MSPGFGEQTGSRHVWSCACSQGVTVKDRHHCRERATYLRRLAKEAQTEALRLSCLKAAEEYEAQAMETDKAEAD
jgi:hypothetical protein